MKHVVVLALASLVLIEAACAQTAQLGPVSTIPSAGDRELQGAAFLTRLRLADPDYRVILIACLKENELNLLLNRDVKAAEIPTVVTGLLHELSRSFPGRNLSVVAFRPVFPLQVAQAAALDAHTGHVTMSTPPPGPLGPVAPALVPSRSLVR